MRASPVENNKCHHWGKLAERPRNRRVKRTVNSKGRTPMRTTVLAVAATALLATHAFAQDIRAAAPAQPVNPAVKGIHENNSVTPVPGANSFTRSQAKSNME